MFRRFDQADNRNHFQIKLCIAAAAAEIWPLPPSMKINCGSGFSSFKRRLYLRKTASFIEAKSFAPSTDLMMKRRYSARFGLPFSKTTMPATFSAPEIFEMSKDSMRSGKCGSSRISCKSSENFFACRVLRRGIAAQRRFSRWFRPVRSYRAFARVSGRRF